MEAALMAVAALLLALGAIAIALVVHAIGLGRVVHPGALGLPGKRLRADAFTYRSAHRAATPLTWLAGSVAAVAAVGALVAALMAGVEEWAVLVVLAAIVLVVGLALATWRAHASLAADRPD